jgi:hypothetical protein
MRLYQRHAASIQELTTAKDARGWSRTTGRNHAVGKGSVGGTRRTTQTGARPDEFVPFGENDPGAGIVKLEPVLDLGRDSDREGRVLRRATVMGSTGTCVSRLSSFRSAATMAQGRSYWPSSGPQMLAIPDVALADDEAGDRSRKPQTDHLSSASTCANCSDHRAVRTAFIRSFVNSTVYPRACSAT